MTAVAIQKQFVVEDRSVWRWWHHCVFVLIACWGLSMVVESTHPKKPIRSAIAGVITNLGRVLPFLIPFIALDEPPNIEHAAIMSDGSAAGGHQNHEFVELPPE